MIKATFTVNRNAGSITMKTSGHAKQAAEGKDLICSSASILALTLCQIVTFAHDEGKLKKKPNIQIDSGKSYITATPKPEHFAEILHAFFVIQVGYHLLSRNLPDYVQLNAFEFPEEE